MEASVSFSGARKHAMARGGFGRLAPGSSEAREAAFHRITADDGRGQAYWYCSCDGRDEAA